jgi:hypothetical protein
LLKEIIDQFNTSLVGNTNGEAQVSAQGPLLLGNISGQEVATEILDSGSQPGDCQSPVTLPMPNLCCDSCYNLANFPGVSGCHCGSCQNRVMVRWVSSEIRHNYIKSDSYHMDAVKSVQHAKKGHHAVQALRQPSKK